mgnify:CR=1 FL=1
MNDEKFYKIARLFFILTFAGLGLAALFSAIFMEDAKHQYGTAVVCGLLTIVLIKNKD